MYKHLDWLLKVAGGGRADCHSQVVEDRSGPGEGGGLSLLFANCVVSFRKPPKLQDIDSPDISPLREG